MKQKYGSVSINSNTDQNMGELEQFLKTLGFTKVRAEVWTDIEYAVFVEFGTFKMTPRAMVRQSIPEIENFFADEWVKLPVIFTKADIDSLFSRTVEFAKERIREKTPVKTEDLKKSWKVSEVEYE